MIALALAALVLQPVMDEPGPLRLAATGLDGHEATWVVDGRPAGFTRDREALTVWLPAGPHRVEVSAPGGGWLAMARTDTPGPGVAHVPAWSARAPPEPGVPHVPAAPLASAPLAAALGLIAAGGAVAVRRGRRGVAVGLRSA